MRSNHGQSRTLTEQQKMHWAIEEYRRRIKEAKEAKFHNEAKALKKDWETRHKVVGISKKDAELFLDKAAKQLAMEKQ